jgi:hypothetical protein
MISGAPMRMIVESRIRAAFIPAVFNAEALLCATERSYLTPYCFQ